MKNRWLMALGLVVACLTLIGTSAAAAGPSTNGAAPGPAQPMTAQDEAITSWMRELDRTHHEVPEGRGFVPGPSHPDQGGYNRLIDDFEQAGKDLDVFRGWVLVRDLSGDLYGEYYWGASDCQAKNSNKSAWAIGNGSDGTQLDCGAYYPHGVNSSMLLRLDLSGWDPSVDTLELVFDFWLNLRTEVEGGVVPDGLFVFYHLPTTVGELPFERVVLAKLTGQLPERFWDTPWRIPLNAAADLNDPEREFNLAGMKDVDLEFVMVTKQRDGTTFPEGVFVDNVRLEASEGPGQVTPGTPTTPPPPTTETPTTETPTTETPTTETPTSETPTSETPTSETPTSETPTSETPTVETPTVETPTVETPTVETPTPPTGFMVYLPVALSRFPLVGEPPPATPETETPVPGTEQPTEEPSDTPETPTTEPSDTPGVPTVEPTDTPEPLEVQFPLDAVEDSGITGEVVMRQTDDGIDVEIDLEGTEEGTSHPVHVHMGTCDEIGPVLLPLEPVVDGTSKTLLEGEMLADYTNGDHAIRVHLSADDLETIVACGVIPEA